MATREKIPRESLVGETEKEIMGTGGERKKGRKGREKFSRRRCTKRGWLRLMEGKGKADRRRRNGRKGRR